MKETIFVKKKAETYIYRFLMPVKGLTAKLQENTVLLMDEQGEARFHIPAVYMVDVNGEYSDAVCY